MYFRSDDDLHFAAEPIFDGYDAKGRIGFTLNYHTLPFDADKIKEWRRIALVAVFDCFDDANGELSAEGHLKVVEVSGESKMVSAENPTGKLLSSIGTLSTAFTWSTPVSPVSLGLSFIGDIISRDKKHSILSGSFGNYEGDRVTIGRYAKNKDDAPVLGSQAVSVLFEASSQVASVGLHEFRVFASKDADDAEDAIFTVDGKNKRWSLKGWSTIDSSKENQGKPGARAVFICSQGSYATKQAAATGQALPGSSGSIVGAVLESVPVKSDGSWSSKRRYRKGEYVLFFAKEDSAESVVCEHSP